MKISKTNNSSLNELTSQERQFKYNTSSFFKKKNDDANAFLKKHPIPKEFLK